MWGSVGSLVRQPGITCKTALIVLKAQLLTQRGGSEVEAWKLS